MVERRVKKKKEAIKGVEEKGEFQVWTGDRQTDSYVLYTVRRKWHGPAASLLVTMTTS